eukprot:scaffold518_cov388-Prasinococcus_capsulatus_cf.AAC.22
MPPPLRMRYRSLHVPPTATVRPEVGAGAMARPFRHKPLSSRRRALRSNLRCALLLGLSGAPASLVARGRAPSGEPHAWTWAAPRDPSSPSCAPQQHPSAERWADQRTPQERLQDQERGR